MTEQNSLHYYGSLDEFRILLKKAFPLNKIIAQSFEYGSRFVIGNATISFYHNSRNQKVTIQGNEDKISRTKKVLTNVLDYEAYSKRSHMPYKTKDGHKVRSRAEHMIDDWLYDNKHIHAYETHVPNSDYLCDFYLPDIDSYLEVWADFSGEIGDKYKEQMAAKKRFYHDNNLNLIEIFQTDLHDVEKSMRLKIKKTR
jgi:hypothetical protein